MDLLRVALGLHRGSLNMAKRFTYEALKRQNELESQPLKPYLKMLLKKSRKVLAKADTEKAEDILMFSVLFQNFARRKAMEGQFDLG